MQRAKEYKGRHQPIKWMDKVKEWTDWVHKIALLSKSTNQCTCLTYLNPDDIMKGTDDPDFANALAPLSQNHQQVQRKTTAII